MKLKTMLLGAVLVGAPLAARADSDQLQAVLVEIGALRDQRGVRDAMGRIGAYVSRATAVERERVSRANWEWRNARPLLGDPRTGANAALSDMRRTAEWRISSAIGDRLLALYQPGGAMHGQLLQDIDMMTPDRNGRTLWYTGHIVYQYLNNTSLNPMGFDAGARWFRARLGEIRERAPRQSPQIGAAAPPATTPGNFFFGPPNIDSRNPGNSTGVFWWTINNAGGAMAPGDVSAPGAPTLGPAVRQNPFPPRR